VIPLRPTDDPTAVFEQFVRNWLRLLAGEQFEEAAAQLDEPNAYGIRWSESEVKNAIRSYGRRRENHVTDPGTLAGDGRPNLMPMEDGTGFRFDYDFPLNGEWSDLTAQFEFLRRPEGYAVVLHDIHVL
jgi:hypothetical protein